MMKIAGMEVETKLSLTGLIGLVVLLGSVATAWSNLNGTIQQDHSALIDLQQARGEEVAFHEREEQSIDDVHEALGRIAQALEDHNIHVSPAPEGNLH